MSPPPPPPSGRHLLDRRRFLAQMSGGMGGVALSALLANDGLLAREAEFGWISRSSSRSPWR